MHRSGTSALAGVLSTLGAETGPSLLPAMRAVNPKGFWEHAEIVRIHDELLAALGSTWHSEGALPENWWELGEISPFRDKIREVVQRDLAKSPIAVVKDPKMCRLLPLWLDVLRGLSLTPCFVMCLRDPMEVSQSLARRDGIADDRSSVLWLQHVLEAEFWTRGKQRVLVTFDELLEDWQSVVSSIQSKFALNLETGGPDAQKRVAEFLEPSLRHHASIAETPGVVGALAEKVYEMCCDGANLDARAEDFDAARRETNELARRVSSWSDEIQSLWKLKFVVADRDAKIRLLEDEITRVKSSFSWQVTAPLRAVLNILRKSR